MQNKILSYASQFVHFKIYLIKVNNFIIICLKIELGRELNFTNEKILRKKKITFAGRI